MEDPSRVRVAPDGGARGRVRRGAGPAGVDQRVGIWQMLLMVHVSRWLAGGGRTSAGCRWMRQSGSWLRAGGRLLLAYQLMRSRG